MTDKTVIEEKMAHMQRVIDDLSETVARQDHALRVLGQRVDLLLRREAEREASQGGGAVYGDERPPHY